MYGFVISGPFQEAELNYLPALVRTLTGRGFRVSVCLESGSESELDEPGKDSFRHRKAGAREVVLSSAHRWALLHEAAGPPADERAIYLSRLAPTDLVLLRRRVGMDRSYLTVQRALLDLSGDETPTAPLAVVGNPKNQRVDAPVLGWEDWEQMADLLAGPVGAAEAREGDRTVP